MKKRKARANAAWKGAIILCIILSIFAVFFTSCTKYKGPDEFTSEMNDDFGKDKDKDKDKDKNKDKDNDKDDDKQQGGNLDGELTNPLIPVDGPTESEDPQVTEEPVITPDPSIPSYLLGETEDAGREYLDKIIFLGDSTTYGIGYYYRQGYSDLCPPSQIWTPASGTLTLSNQSTATIVYPESGGEITIKEAARLSQPEIILMTLGVNGVSFMDEQWFIDEYTALINSVKEVSPNTKIILNSIYPVASSYQHIGSISNEKIATANSWIKKIADQNGCKYLNTYEVLVSENGTLPEASHNGDGIHLSGETFGIVMQYIRTHA